MSNDKDWRETQDGLLLKSIRARANGEYKIADVEKAAKVFKRDARFLLGRLDAAKNSQDHWFCEAKKLEQELCETNADNISLRSRLQQIQSEKMLQFGFRKECEARIFVLENDLKDAKFAGDKLNAQLLEQVKALGSALARANDERDSARAELELVKRLSGELERLTIKFHNAIHSTLT
jgi:chromosome segregation ATPase